MKAKPLHRTHAINEQTVWRITLTTGEVLSIYADSHGVEGDEDVFNVLIAGKPNILEVVARIPTSIIQDMISDMDPAEPEG